MKMDLSLVRMLFLPDDTLQVQGSEPGERGIAGLIERMLKVSETALETREVPHLQISYWEGRRGSAICFGRYTHGFDYPCYHELKYLDRPYAGQNEYDKPSYYRTDWSSQSAGNRSLDSNNHRTNYVPRRWS
jgi:hypothetical protein